MTRMQNPNLDLLEKTVDRLGLLADEMVFVGGTVTGLLITDPAAPPIRPTDDVDAIVQVVSWGDYNSLTNRLRENFSEDISEGAPICRWVADGIILDVMPTDKTILGFGNEWYIQAATNANNIVLPNSGKTIRVITAPYFLVTKLDAFAGRGRGDFQSSHDIEDIISVLDGRAELFAEIQDAQEKVKTAIANNFTEFLQNRKFIDAMPGHLPPDASSSARLPVLINIIQSIANIS